MPDVEIDCTTGETKLRDTGFLGRKPPDTGRPPHPLAAELQAANSVAALKTVLLKMIGAEPSD